MGDCAWDKATHGCDHSRARSLNSRDPGRQLAMEAPRRGQDCPMAASKGISGGGGVVKHRHRDEGSQTQGDSRLAVGPSQPSKIQSRRRRLCARTVVAETRQEACFPGRAVTLGLEGRGQRSEIRG